MAKGSVLTLSANYAIEFAGADIVWDAEALIGGGSSRWAASPGTTITVEAALDGVVAEAFCYLKTVASAERWAEIRKNGTAIAKANTDTNEQSISLRSGPVLLSTGDTFTAFTRRDGTVANWGTNSRFGLLTLPRLGLVSARLAANFVGARTALTWATPEVDTLSTHNGTTRFTAPTGAAAAVISMNHYNPTDQTFDSDIDIEVSTIVVSQAICENDHMGGPQCFGVFPMTAGDFIEVFAAGSGQLLAANCQICIEWVGAA